MVAVQNVQTSSLELRLTHTCELQLLTGNLLAFPETGMTENPAFHNTARRTRNCLHL